MTFEVTIVFIIQLKNIEASYFYLNSQGFYLKYNHQNIRDCLLESALSIEIKLEYLIAVIYHTNTNTNISSL